VRAFVGWPLGVAGGRAYFARRDGAEIAIERAGLDGEPERLGKIPPPGGLEDVLGVVTGDGHVVMVGAQRLHVIAPDRSVRDIEVPAGVHGIAANPAGSEVALVTGLAVDLIDSATGQTRWSAPYDARLWAAEGEIGFVGNEVVADLHRSIDRYELANGRRLSATATAYIDQRNLAFGPGGSELAYTDSVRPTDTHPFTTRHGCDVYVLHAGAPPPVEPVARFETSCYFGLGLLYVGRELWIAPL
jgi:hypothetical protein